MPAETDPKAAFQRIFQEGGDLWARDTFGTSLLDRIKPQTATLAAKLGPEDRSRLADYLHHLRELEQRSRNPVDMTRRDVACFVMDLVALAFQTNVTRVATIMLGREKSRCTFPELNIAETHHQLSHAYRDERTIDKLYAIDRYHAELFAHFVARLNGMETATGNVLDSSILLFGSGLSDGISHRHDNLPIVVAGGIYTPSDLFQDPRSGQGRKLTDLHTSILQAFDDRSRQRQL